MMIIPYYLSINHQISSYVIMPIKNNCFNEHSAITAKLAF